MGTIAEQWLKEGAKLGEARGEARGKAQGHAQGHAQGQAQGWAESIVVLVRDGLISITDAQQTLQRATREGRLSEEQARDAWAQIQAHATEH